MINMQPIEEKRGIMVRCPRCGYTWTYRGRKTYYIRCPNCSKLMKIEENRVRG